MVDIIEVVTNAGVLFVIGISIFAFSCTVLASGAESFDDERFRAALLRSNGGWSGVYLGTVFTAIIQSSASTILLTIGLVNAGVMGLGAAAAIIYGANIGTTVTAHIVAWGMSVDATPFFCGLACLSALACLVLRENLYKKIAGVILSLAMIFIGLGLVSLSMSGTIDSILDFISRMNFLMLIGLGFLITSVVQSSSITTSLIVTAISAGSLGLTEGVYIALGSNLGSCVVVLVAGYGGTVDAERSALVHFFFNVIGVTVFVLVDILSFGGFVKLLDFVFGNKQVALALFHTLFKVTTTLIVLPYTDQLIRFVTKLAPEREGSYFTYNLMLQNPPIGLQQLKSEVVNMSLVAISNFKIAIEMIRTMNFSEIDQFRGNRDELNRLNREISHFLVKVNNIPLNKKDRTYVLSIYHTITDMERVGYYAGNIVEYARKMRAANCRFPDSVNDEIVEIRNLVCDLCDKVIRVYHKMDKKYLREIFDVEEKINVIANNMRGNHTQRSSDGGCVVSTGVGYLLLAYDVERITDHFVNMGKAARRMS